jgi:hypothetical protein
MIDYASRLFLAVLGFDYLAMNRSELSPQPTLEDVAPIKNAYRGVRLEACSAVTAERARRGIQP